MFAIRPRAVRRAWWSLLLGKNALDRQSSFSGSWTGGGRSTTTSFKSPKQCHNDDPRPISYRSRDEAQMDFLEQKTKNPIPTDRNF